MAGHDDELAQAREELRQLKSRYFAMVEQAPEAIVVFDLDDGHFVEVNAQACRLYGMERDELLRLEGPISVSPEVQPDGRDSAGAAMGFIEQAMTGAFPTFEWVHLRNRTDEVLCRIQLARVPVEGRRLVRASMVDISAAKASETERDLLRAIVEVTPDFIGLGDMQGRGVFLNPAGRAMLGIGLDEDVQGIDIAQFHTEEHAALLRDVAFPSAVRDGLWRGEMEFVSRSGRVFPAHQVIIAHKNRQGEVGVFSTIARDISEQRAAEALERKMLQAQKLESLGVLAGGIAHDFNNILTGILGHAGLLLRGLPAGVQLRQSAASIETAALRAADLAQQMLAYVGQTKPVAEQIEVDELVRDVSALVEASIAKTTRLSFDFEPDVPAIVGDRTQLRQVVMNLIINASDALDGKPGDVRVRTCSGDIDRSELSHDYLPDDAEDVVTIDVTDTGAGMSQDVVDRIFDPFFTTKFTGRGLGLAAVLGIVRAHKGGIYVDTAPGKGSQFRFSFAPASELQEGPSIVQQAPRTWHGSGVALVVDDEMVVRQLIARVLHQLGFDVVEADNGRTGVTMFRETAEQVRVVVLDLTMPEMSGDEVLEQIRQIRADVPVILMSGFSEPDRAPTAEAFLHKPFGLDELEQTVRRLLEGE